MPAYVVSAFCLSLPCRTPLPHPPLPSSPALLHPFCPPPLPSSPALLHLFSPPLFSPHPFLLPNLPLLSFFPLSLLLPCPLLPSIPSLTDTSFFWEQVDQNRFQCCLNHALILNLSLWACHEFLPHGRLLQRAIRGKPKERLRRRLTKPRLQCFVA